MLSAVGTALLVACLASLAAAQGAPAPGPGYPVTMQVNATTFSNRDYVTVRSRAVLHRLHTGHLRAVQQGLGTPCLHADTAWLQA